MDKNTGKLEWIEYFSNAAEEMHLADFGKGLMIRYVKAPKTMRESTMLEYIPGMSVDDLWETE